MAFRRAVHEAMDLGEPTTPEPTPQEPNESEPRTDPARLPISRRQLLGYGVLAVSGVVGTRVVFDWLIGLGGRPTSQVNPVAAGYDPTAHRWGFVVDASKCIGCGVCVVACKEENGVPLDAEHTRTWVERQTLEADGGVTVESPQGGINGFKPASSAPTDGPGSGAQSQFVPRLCMQCEEPPCTAVCPVGATYRTADGVILVDEERCIGCGYCLLACPYGARYLVPAGARSPRGIPGVADKCTFCYHRITRGQDPACVEVCPVQARLFGDLNDATSRVSTILREQHTTVMRPELGTRPRVHYVGLEGEAKA